MDSSKRDLLRALGIGVIIAVCLVLVATLRGAGIILAVVVVACGLVYMRRSLNDPETASLQASLTIARDDIADILAQYDTLLHGAAPEAIAERTFYFPALADPGCEHPTIQDFQLRASAARRFVARVDTHLTAGDLDRAQLHRLIAVADERALELATAWRDARRAAREIGPS
ncbi:hypothetical protein [Corynebacterium auris]|uniref:hypothetical protein n=1 Tax=Corynebacterium auris TaxID=44750 RepID=UPI0025B61B9A|nr:hypothetical protein [Corynebacterium auris]WJY68240.1 hypothetical protein CAURIS_06725 [Corynebacterium auris]